MIIEKRIPLKYWFNKVKWEVLYVALLSTSIYFVSEYLIDLSVPISIGVFLGSAIALLLSFKLSQSYNRWWEARKIWGAIVNDSRSLVIQLKGFSKNNENGLIEIIANRQIGWCYSLSKSLRKSDPLEGMESFILSDELKSLKNHKNVPLAILDLHAQDLRELRRLVVISDFQYI